MMPPAAPDAALLREIQLLRRQITELETEAGIRPSSERSVHTDREQQRIGLLRGIVQNLLIGFAVGNPHGRIVDANQAFARMLGYTRDDLLDTALTWRRLTPPEFLEADRSARDALLQTGLPFTYRKELLRRDGSRLPVVVCAIATDDPRDDHAAFVLDDSARIAAESELRKVEQLHQSVLDAIPDLVLLADPKERIVWANQAFLAFFGTTLAEITGAFAPPSWSPAMLASLLIDCASVLESGVTVDRPFQERIRADGETRTLHVMTAPIFDATGRVVRTVSIARDVTDRARDEAALLRSEANLRTAEALAHASSFEFDVPSRNNDYWSNELYEILGMPPESAPIALLEAIDEFTHPEDRERVRSTALTALHESSKFDIEYRVRRADGVVRFVRSIGEGMRSPEGVGGRLVGTLIDVTAEHERRAERAALEVHLRRAQRLEAAATLALGVARDLEDILATIKRHASAAYASKTLTPGSREDLGHVLSAAERASRLAGHLLVFSQGHRPRRERIDFATPLSEALAHLRPVLPDRVEIQTAIADTTPQILADETQIVQLALNLLTNAIHAMEACGGVLTVRLEPLVIDAEFARSHPGLHRGRYARLTVSDTGSGIAPEHLERVLEPFFTTKPPGKGMGLGLSVVHGIVREHGGAIEISSNPGEGTTVQVALPAFGA